MIVTAKDGKQAVEWFRLAGLFADGGGWGVPILASLLADQDKDGNLTLTATDKYILATVTTGLRVSGNGGPFLVPTNGIRVVLPQVAQAGKRPLRLQMSHGRAVWTWGDGHRYSHPLTKGEFPAYEQIMKQTGKGGARSTVCFGDPLVTLGRARAQVAKMTKDATTSVRLDLRGDGAHSPIGFTIRSAVTGAVMGMRG